MRKYLVVLAVCMVLGVLATEPAAAAPQPQGADPLTRARQAYNLQQFDQAVTFASTARQTPAVVHSASLVMARALLERFRRAGDVADVATARQALLSIDISRLSPRERGELHLGMAELLFVDGQYGAAAELFEGALDRAGFIDTDQREHVLEWWAASLDRHAQLAPDAERHVRYRRLLTRLEQEAIRGAASATVTYWLAAATRGVDDPDRAWSLVIAGWIQAPLVATGAKAEALRTDLDRLMREAVIPERARRAAPPSDPEALAVALRAEWQAIKGRWTSGGIVGNGGIVGSD